MNKTAGVACAAFGLAAAAGAWAQGGPDELWNMSTRMEMAGMPAQAMDHQVCMQKGETQPEKMSQDKNCKVTEQRKVGNTFSWKIVCTGRDAMTGEGQMTRSGNAMDGRMRMQGKSGGETMDMTIVYTGKLAGGCNAGERQQAAVKQQQAMIAQSEAQLAQGCREAMENYQPYLFDGDRPVCATQKAEFCGRAKKAAQTMRTPEGYRNLSGKTQWDHVGKVCNVDYAPVLAAACKNAMGGRNWDFVGEHCPAEAKGVATEHCAGRSYTVAMSSEYKGVCSRYASRDAAPRAAAQAPAAPKPTDAVKEGVKEGARALRKLFGN